MPNVVKASWRRVVSVKPYETETLELGVEKDFGDGSTNADALVAEAVSLERVLAEAGDALLVERARDRRDATEPPLDEY